MTCLPRPEDIGAIYRAYIACLNARDWSILDNAAIEVQLALPLTH